MATKFHVNNEGKVNECHAGEGKNPRGCPLGEERHFLDREEAYAFYENEMESEDVNSLSRMKTQKTLDEIAPQSMWNEMVEKGYVNKMSHPTEDLHIYDYSKAAAYGRVWNPVTLASRGLIADGKGNIHARPFGKFFNYGELDEENLKKIGLDMNTRVISSDKKDGSMGVAYVEPSTGRTKISTRGSFSSDQAKHASEVYAEKYEGKWNPKKGETYLYEIIYPENRIVLDYGDKDDLVLIGRVNNKTGISTPLNEVNEWPGEKAEVFEHKTFADSLKAEPRENAEGIVVHIPESDARVKIKQDDYVRLHRMATGVNSTRVWELMSNHPSLKSDKRADGPQNINELVAESEEEFKPYIFNQSQEFERERLAKNIEYQEKLKDFYKKLGYKPTDGKDFMDKLKADKELSKDDRSILQSLHYRGPKSVDRKAWDAIRPYGKQATLFQDPSLKNVS